MADPIKCTVMLADLAEWPAFNEVHHTRFTARFTITFPRRKASGVSGLAFSVRVEVECIEAVARLRQHLKLPAGSTPVAFAAVNADSFEA